MIDRDRYLRMLRKMQLIRVFEDTVSELFHMDKVAGMVHLCLGQEATGVGVCEALRPDDYLSTAHRSHGHCLAKGSAAQEVMAELMGRETGLCKGKGGSMHLVDMAHGFLGANGVVGGGIPMVVGAALSAQYRGTDQVGVAFFGDGAANQAAFHESLNLAAVWKLGVLFVCENNLYGISTRANRAFAIADVADRAASYGMPGVVVDGMDVLAVYEQAVEAVGRARQGEGPTLIECKTYRFTGHFVGDPAKYRTKEELGAWKKRDPIELFRAWLVERGFLDEEGWQRIVEEVATEVEGAVGFAEASPFPAPEELMGDVLA